MKPRCPTLSNLRRERRREIIGKIAEALAVLALFSLFFFLIGCLFAATSPHH